MTSVNIIYIHTTRFITSPRTRSPISGDISEPNCIRVVRNLFSLLNCLAPQAGGSWLIELPIPVGDIGPVGLEWTPFTTGEVVLDSDRTSATIGAEELDVGEDTGGPFGGCAAVSVGESGMLASLRSISNKINSMRLIMALNAQLCIKCCNI